MSPIPLEIESLPVPVAPQGWEEEDQYPAPVNRGYARNVLSPVTAERDYETMGRLRTPPMPRAEGEALVALLSVTSVTLSGWVVRQPTPAAPIAVILDEVPGLPGYVTVTAEMWLHPPGATP